MARLKRYSVNDLRPGMFVHDLGCRWLDHPFSFNQFLLRDGTTIGKVKASGIVEVVVDLDRCTVGEETPKSPTTDNETPFAERPAPAAGPPARPLDREMAVARTIHREANATIATVMQDMRLGKQVEIERVTPVVEGMAESIFHNKNALLSLGRIREGSLYTFQHSVNVGVLLMTFARYLELEKREIVDIGVGGMLHDIGKTMTPPEILNKPGGLTAEELQVMRMHVVHSKEVLLETPGIPPLALDIAAMHHERYDGTGYPLGLKGEQISKVGQMASIVDVYDAITSDRCYHRGEPPSLVLRRLLEWSGSHFDTPLVHQFIHCVGIFPPGSLVRLTNNLIGVVLEGNVQHSLAPRINVFFNVEKRAYVGPFVLDLADLPERFAGEKIAGFQDPVELGVHPEEYLL